MQLSFRLSLLVT